MQKSDLPYLVFGVLITAVAACRSTTDTTSPFLRTTLEPQWIDPAAVAGKEPSDDLSGNPTDEAMIAPPLPTPQAMADNWKPLGSDRARLSLGIPSDWSDLTDRIDVPAMGNRLGINLVFAADSDRTGRSLLAGKPFADGAYISGLIVSPPAPMADPATTLIELLNAAAPSAVRLTPLTPLVSANGVTGYYVDVADGPIGLNAAAPNDLRTRVILYALPVTGGASDFSWIALLQSASFSRWEQYAGIFDEMLQSVRVFDVRPGVVAREGNVVVRGQLVGDRDVVTASLERSVNDLWTFSTDGNRYASLFLTPDDPDLDLALTLLGPDRQIVAQVENGFTGDTESITDLLLAEPGVYIAEVSEFSRGSGPYTLTLVQSDQPQYSGGGSIALGQALQAELPAGARHYWVFSGTAGQQINIVVEPGTPTLDATLELFGPDGRRLLALDEGFSGDPEVVSGFELPVSGEFALMISSFSAGGGPYTVSLDQSVETIANFYDAGDLAYGDVRRESLQPREAHAWFFQGQAGDYILVRITPISPGLDPDLWLLDGKLERVAAADAFAEGEPETVELTLIEDGQFIILVRDFNGEAGEYEVALGAAPIATPENAGSLSYGDIVIGMIKPGTAVAWSFNAQAGDIVDVEVVPAESSSDIVVQLQGPDGLTTLEIDDRPAGETESVDAFVVPAAGSWQVVLREFFGDTANYRLALGRAQ